MSSSYSTVLVFWQIFSMLNRYIFTQQIICPENVVTSNDSDVALESVLELPETSSLINLILE